MNNMQCPYYEYLLTRVGFIYIVDYQEPVSFIELFD